MIVNVAEDKGDDDDGGEGEGIVGGRWGRDSGDGQEMKKRTKRGDGVRG